jgi:hypothetical protein
MISFNEIKGVVYTPNGKGEWSVSKVIRLEDATPTNDGGKWSPKFDPTLCWELKIPVQGLDGWSVKTTYHNSEGLTGKMKAIHLGMAKREAEKYGSLAQVWAKEAWAEIAREEEERYFGGHVPSEDSEEWAKFARYRADWLAAEEEVCREEMGLPVNVCLFKGRHEIPGDPLPLFSGWNFDARLPEISDEFAWVAGRLLAGLPVNLYVTGLTPALTYLLSLVGCTGKLTLKHYDSDSGTYWDQII